MLLHFVNVRHIVNFHFFLNVFTSAKYLDIYAILCKKAINLLHFILESCASSHGFSLMTLFDLELLFWTLNCFFSQQVTGLKIKLCPKVAHDIYKVVG